MEPKFQSSFIPKGPVSPSGNFNAPKSKSLVSTIAVFIFALSIVMAIGVFGYERYLLARIGTMGSDLETARTTIKPEVIKDLSRMDARITSTATLLKKHTALSSLFKFIEANTLRNVRFTEFSYGTTDKGIILSMKGEARGYSAVALQSEMFNRSPYIKTPVFSDLDLDTKGNVTFSFQATLDPLLISYEKSIEGNVVVPVVPVTPVTTVGTSTVKTTATSTATSTKPR